MYAFEQQSRAARMKLRAQAAIVRARLDQLIDDQGAGRVVVMGDLNDSPEFDIYAAKLGGAFLEPVMGSHRADRGTDHHPPSVTLDL